MAQRLISRKRLEEALDLLNETIRQAPRFAQSFENRAAVFEALGMYPQAEADRRKAAALRAARPGPPPPEITPAGPPSEPEPAEGSETATEEAGGVAESEDYAILIALPPELEKTEAPPAEEAPLDAVPSPEESPPPVMPSYRAPRQPSIGGALLRAAGVVLFVLGMFILAGVGIYLAVDAIGDGGDETTSAATDPPAPTTGDGAEEEASGIEPEGAASVTTEDLTGSPYSFSHLEDAWHARALAVVVGDVSESVTGFGEPAIDVTLAGSGATMDLSVLIYDSADAKDAEWTLGVSPEPKAGEVPAEASVWYNANAVVVVRVSSEALRQDALDGFLGLAGAAQTADGEG